MEKLNDTTKKIMIERFGKDNIIALATCENNMPYVRGVNAFYEDGTFYIITYALSDKMKQIEKNPTVALSGEWFTAHGTAENMGWFRKPENAPLAAKLRGAFSEWIDNGHNNFEDENVIILKIKLTHGVLFSNGVRYEIDFSEI